MVAHCVLLMLLIVSQKGDYEHEKFLITTNSLGSTVVFMPLHKKMPTQQNTHASATVGQSRRVITHDAYQKALASKNKSKQVAAGVKKAVPVKTKTGEQVAVPKPVPSPTTLRSEKAQPIVEKKKAETGKKAAQPELKKVVEKSVEKKKPVEKPVENVVKKQTTVAVKKDPVVEKIKPIEVEKIKKVESVAPVAPVAQVQDQSIEQDVVPAVQSMPSDSESTESEDLQDSGYDTNIDLDNVSFVGRYDLEKYEIQEKIRTEITKHWKFPFGVNKATSCELGITVGPDGKVILVMIKKGSGILVYDMSAKAAAYQSQFPKEVYGKEFTIVLGC